MLMKRRRSMRRNRKRGKRKHGNKGKQARERWVLNLVEVVKACVMSPCSFLVVQGRV